MSAPIASLSFDDDGPEEGEIEDDDDELILCGSNPQSSSATSSNLEVYGKPLRKDSYERDIRNFELHRSRSAWSGVSESDSKGFYSLETPIHGNDTYSRPKSKHSRAVTSQGKENRHIHRHKSPVHRHHRGSYEKTLVNLKDVSPKRDSSCSSVESDGKFAPYRSTQHRADHKSAPKLDRRKKRSSSSPEPVTHPIRRRSHHSSGKCPLIKVLHSVAKQTRRAIDTESQTESSTLRQRLLNMGVMSALHDEGQAPQKEKDKGNHELVCNSSVASRSNSVSSSRQADLSKLLNSEGTQTDAVCRDVAPDIVTLSDSDDEMKDKIFQSSSNINTDPSLLHPEAKMESTLKTNNFPHEESVNDSCVASPTTAVCNRNKKDEDDDEDIFQLRLLALQSKKHEQSPPEDGDVLELRLAALKTAFMKKFKTRKNSFMKVSTKETAKDPLSPLDEIPLPLSPPSPDEVMTPVDMDLAETDDDETSVHSMHCYSPSDPIPECYSPSDPVTISECFPPSPVPEESSPSHPFPECYSPSQPTGSPSLEPSLQDLLPPPPPPDLDLYFSDSNADSPMPSVPENNMHSYFVESLPSELAAPPPIPAYLRKLLSDVPDDPYINSPLDFIQPSAGSGICILDSHIYPPEMQEQEYCTPALDHDRIDEEDVDVTCREPRSVSSNLIKIPIVSNNDLENAKQKSDITTSCAAPLQKSDQELAALNCEENSKNCPSFSECSRIKPDTAVDNMSSEPISDDCEKVHPAKPIKEVVLTNSISLEEEEKLLRQRLLLNMANKRRIHAQITEKSKEQLIYEEDRESLPTVQPGKVQQTQLGVYSSEKSNKSNKNIDKKMELSTTKSKMPIGTISVVVAPESANDKRFIINLGEDSDSSEDYSEAEALGLKCARNRQQWIAQMKDLEANPAKLICPANKIVPSAGGVQLTNQPKAKHLFKDRNVKKPFAENLADLESSVERFLKGVRSSQEVNVPKGSSGSLLHATPVALKHLPASQQEEYRRLKQRIAKLEKQRLLSKGSQKLGSSISIGTQMSAIIPNQTSKSASHVPKPAQNTSIAFQGHNKGKKNEKTEHVVKRPKISLESEKVLNHASTSILSQTDANNSFQTIIKSISVQDKSSMPVNISNCDGKLMKPVGSASLSNQLRSVSSPNESSAYQQRLINLERILVSERSHVLMELSELSKLFVQVDKSLEGQSHTAAEVSRLIDKLCLAAGRWKAQNQEVTGLVEKVYQRQKDLASRHTRCITASKSCVLLGNKLLGKSYRIPTEKADAIRMQLTKVHQKTQELSKRRTIEQTRKASLEKRAENCLMKLFSDARSTNSMVGKTKLGERLPIAVKSSRVDAPISSQSSLLQSVATKKRGPFPTPQVLGKKEADVLPSTSIKSGNKSVSHIVQVSSASLSRAANNRLVQNKLRSAKAVLNIANRKRLCSGENNSNPKALCANNRLRGEIQRDDLSDMDISTDGDEPEKRVKDLGGNTDVVDMSVSPDTSPSRIERDSINLQDGCCSQKNVYSAPDLSLEGNKQSIEGVFADCSGNFENNNSMKVAEKVKGEEQVKEETALAETEVSSLQDRCGYSISSNGVLKDYISPLGGLKVFSDSQALAGDDDLYAILCPYDLNGKCQDSDCPFKHQDL